MRVLGFPIYPNCQELPRAGRKLCWDEYEKGENFSHFSFRIKFEFHWLCRHNWLKLSPSAFYSCSYSNYTYWMKVNLDFVQLFNYY